MTTADRLRGLIEKSKTDAGATVTLIHSIRAVAPLIAPVLEPYEARGIWWCRMCHGTLDSPHHLGKCRIGALESALAKELSSDR